MGETRGTFFLRPLEAAENPPTSSSGLWTAAANESSKVEVISPLRPDLLSRRRDVFWGPSLQPGWVARRPLSPQVPSCGWRA